MHDNGVVHYNLDTTNILVDDEKNVKLFNWGLFYMTNQGKYVSFPIGNVKYTPPERLLGSKRNIKGDIWSVALIIAELLLDCTFWSSLKIGQITRKVLSLLSTNNVLEKIAREHDKYQAYSELDPLVRNLLESCLSLISSKRPLPEDLLTHEIFTPNLEELIYKSGVNGTLSLLHRCTLSQIYYWWQLAGGDVLAELKREGLIKNEAPILSTPK